MIYVKLKMVKYDPQQILILAYKILQSNLVSNVCFIYW
jgi:hypothetical protein